MPLPCTHPEACQYRYRYKGITRRYCMACIVEKFPETNVDNMLEEMRKEIKAKTTKVK